MGVPQGFRVLLSVGYKEIGGDPTNLLGGSELGVKGLGLRAILIQVYRYFFKRGTRTSLVACRWVVGRVISFIFTLNVQVGAMSDAKRSSDSLDT